MKKSILFFLFIFCYITGSAQSGNDVPVTLETPYNTIYVHLFYLQPDSYRPVLAARTINSIQDSVLAVKRVIQLKQILDGKGLFVRINTLPKEVDYRDTLTGKALYTPFPNVLPEVYLEQVDQKWYYSEETVNLIPELHKEVFPFGADALLNILPKFSQQKILGLAIWQYFGILLLLTTGLILNFILTRLFRPFVRRLTRSKLYPSLIPPELVWKIARLFSILVIVRLLMTFLPALQLPVKSTEFTVLVIKIVTIMLIVMILMKVIDILMLYFGRFTKKTESKLDEQLLPILQRTIQAIIIAIGIIQILRGLRVDVTTLIAGISIGGLAIALAAQDTIKNLFGSLTIFMDQPFQIGDWINFSDVDGTVEEVGFRSTRVRTFANSLVYVPNGKLADMIINNYGLRAFRRFKTTVSITYDTPPHLITTYIEGLREIIKTHPDTRKDVFEIHLSEMGSHSLDILIYIFFAVPDWTNELRARHEVLLAFIELAENLGVKFAFPTTSIHVEEFPGQEIRLSSDRNDPKLIQEKYDRYLEDFKSRYKGNE